MDYRKIFLLSALALSTLQTVNSATITNNISGVGPKNELTNPYFCILNADGQMAFALKPGSSIDGNQYSGNPYYVGAALRFGGCEENNTYLGYVGFSVNEMHQNKFSTYTPPAGVHVTYNEPAIDGHGNITGKIQYTAIQPNFHLLKSPPSQNPDWLLVGINLSGLEFSKMIDPVVVPNLSLEDVGPRSDLNEIQIFLQKGMNTIRVPVRWGYLQLEGPGKGDINLDYFNSYVKPLLETLTSAKVNTIVDLHSYMHYSIFGKEYAGCGMDGPCPDGKLILNAKAYQDIWTKLYSLIKADPKINMDYVLLDLVNEPVGVPDDLVFTIQAAVIKNLRNQGFNGYILVEGNAWSGLHSWSESWTARNGSATYSNATLFSRENFAKAGITDLSKIIINAHQYLDQDYSGTHDMCQTDLNTKGAAGFNLASFVDYLQQNHLKAIITEVGVGRDKTSCTVALNQFLNYLKDNSSKNKDYGFMGWTIWSTGHGWGDNYNLRLTPTSYQMQILQKYLQPMQQT